LIDVLIITKNEEANIGFCLQALKGWTNKIFVVDSGSTDQTKEIAESHGAEVIHHDWLGFAKQKNWALDNLEFESDWTLIVDADEVITPTLRKVLEDIAFNPVDQEIKAGFFINRLTFFLGKPIRHCGYFPNYHLRFFKTGMGRYEEREVHEHIILDGPVGRITTPMLHDDRRGLEHYIAKHNRYSTLESQALLREIKSDKNESKSLEPGARRRRWAKRTILPRVPIPGLIRFFYMYILRGGFLDGWTGLFFCRFIATYDDFVALKLRALVRGQRLDHTGVEGLSDVKIEQDASSSTVVPVRTDSHRQMHPEASPWTFREKVGRALWMLFGRTLFRATFHNWYGIRRQLLRMFGAHIGADVAIRPTVHVEVPWMIHIEDGATIGDYAIIYSLGPIRIGARSIISQYAHLCAGTHDYADHTFRLIRAPITIGDDVWIGADSFVGPGVKIGDLAVLGARSSAYKNLEGGRIHVGNPARDVKERNLK
jgi:acetyltransferase-like isoleucine patch superfamily enzyme